MPFWNLVRPLDLLQVFGTHIHLVARVPSSLGQSFLSFPFLLFPFPAVDREEIGLGRYIPDLGGSGE